MKLDSIYKTTKTGLTVEFRSAKEDDAEALIDYLKKTCGETRFLLSEPEEVTFTVDGEKAFLKSYEESGNSVMINAYVDGKLAGNASFAPVGDRMRVKHRADMGIALFQEYCHQGIGELLMEIIIEKARECGYEILELEVVSSNVNAFRLYQKHGFRECGKTVRAFKYKDGTYDSEIHMQLML